MAKPAAAASSKACSGRWPSPAPGRALRCRRLGVTLATQERPGAAPLQGGGMNDLSGTNGPGAAFRRRTEGDPAVFVLKRELSEVHLLLDNVSANPMTTVADRTDVTRPAILKDDWIERICDINWPPELDADKASDAALLISAKDYLNRLAHPASGATIAFTHLVTQEADDASRKRRRGRGQDDGDGQGAVQTRTSLAEIAYPDLLSKAVKFRAAMLLMSIGLLLALLVTCLLSWHVAYGNAMLAEYQTEQAALDRAVAGVTQGGTTAAVEGTGTTVRAAPLSVAAICGPLHTATPAAPGTPGTPGTPATSETAACATYAEARQTLRRVQQRLALWECWLCSDPAKLSETGIADAPKVASAWANILGSAVLPFFYGLLGAGAAIIRSLSRKIRASRLSPRDLMLSVQQLALGAVVGACIGLFIAAPGGDATGEGVLGPVALSASAVSFIAGFGVDAVFQGLEALIGRIFNLSNPAPSTGRGDAAPPN